MDFNNSFKCRLGGKDLSNVQFNPKLWNLRPVVEGTKDAVKILAWQETCSCEGTPGGVVGALRISWSEGCCWGTSTALAPRVRAAQDVEERILSAMRGWSRASLVGTLMPFPDVRRREKIKAVPSRKHECLQVIGTICTHELTTSLE